MNPVLHFAIIGAGPAGFFAAADLLKRLPDARVDILERLFAPNGLVRYGVAPDHPKTKSVEKVFANTLADPRVRFFGGVDVGATVSVEELRARYTALIFTHGAIRSKAPGLPGESRPGALGAAEFVAWYNGHPDFQDLNPDLSHETAVVIGNGNVAMDCARILAQDPEHLEKTDITDTALAALRASRIRRVLVVGRRGPAQAAFTAPEISELREFPGLTVTVDPRDLELNDASRAELALPTARVQNRVVELLGEYASSCSGIRQNSDTQANVNDIHQGSETREIRFVFFRSPEALLGEAQVEQIRLGHTRLEGEAGKQRAVPTGESETLPCGLVLFSIGYAGKPLPGLPFDPKRGVVPNTAGRVTGLPGVYTAGWIKRGPQGIIGTNKKDAAETVDALMADLTAGLLKPVDTPPEFPGAVSAAEWKRIDAAEIANGAAAGRPRVKFTRRPYG
jgi:ferredoxin/flavodoxin---NADP+ reductase